MMMDKIDYKKTEKALYQPKKTPSVVTVPPMTMLMVDGQGDPNDPAGSYSEAVGLLYALSYTIKMSKMGADKPAGYFEYVVPPLEGLWWMAGREGVDYAHKELFIWTAMIRQPEFVDEAVFRWACQEVQSKKGLDTAKARLATLDEGLCIQCLHTGPYDDEPATVAKLHQFAADEGLTLDYANRRHHEIYLSDPRRTQPEKLKTVLRLPVTR